MGQENSTPIKKNFHEYKHKYDSSRISKSNFEFLYVIGRGGFGKVWKVKHKNTLKLYALKEMSKLKIIDRKSVKSIKTEREFLSKLHHPFLVNMIYSFQDRENLYLVMDLFLGGDLRYHISHKKTFDEVQSKFFCACVILGLENIHKNNIIHRDIKPENLVLDSNGYVAITDFGVAKENKEDNSSETSGTPGYMAPEVLCGQNHTFTADFFAVGVMCYEFLKGHRPYLGRNRQEIKEAVLARQAYINKKDLFQNGWSFDAENFINKMLYRKPHKRLGNEGINQIKENAWFKSINWDELLKKNITSPYIPKYGDNFDKRYCEEKENIDSETMERYQIYRNKEKFKYIFQDYTFIREESQENIKSIEYNNIKNYKSSEIISDINNEKSNEDNEENLIENNIIINNESNEISEEIKKPIELNNSLIFKNEISQFINKEQNPNPNQNNNIDNKFMEEKSKINFNKEKYENRKIEKNNNENNSIKNIMKYFEEPENDLQVKNIINRDNNNDVDIENSDLLLQNFDNNTSNRNAIEKKEINMNRNNDDQLNYNNLEINNKKENEINYINYEFKKIFENKEINKNNFSADDEDDAKNIINIDNNTDNNNPNDELNKIIDEENKVHNFYLDYNNINNKITLVKNKTSNNALSTKKVFKNKNINYANTYKNNHVNKKIKSAKYKSNCSNNENESNKRISSVNHNRNIKTGKNNNFSTINKFHYSNKLEKNNLKNNFALRKEIKSSLSRTYKINNNKNDAPVSLSNNHLNKNINIKNNNYINSSKDNTINKNSKNNNNSQSKNLVHNSTKNNFKITYNYNIPLHSSKIFKSNGQSFQELQKKTNSKNSKISQNKVLDYIKRGKNIKNAKNNNKDNDKMKKLEDKQYNINYHNNKKDKIIYKVSSMKFLSSNKSNDLSNNSTIQNNNNNNIHNSRTKKSICHNRSHTAKYIKPVKNKNIDGINSFNNTKNIKKQINSNDYKIMDKNDQMKNNILQNSKMKKKISKKPHI